MNAEPLNIESARSKMIEQQIRPWNVLDPNVLALLNDIPRELFVPQNHRHLAFVDMEIPLPEGQVMLAPKVEARLLQELSLRPTDQVLEIGAGSGFMAAMMAKLAGNVLTVEKYPSLAQFAEDNLRRAELHNVEVMVGNGLESNPRWTHASFDAIAVSGATDTVPEHLVNRLNPGGRMVAIIGRAPVMQAVLIERADTTNAQAVTRTTVLFETLTQALEDAPKISRFAF
jgi:protein-L-isoaspartate(D-aspartate) O-methyltransferase